MSDVLLGDLIQFPWLGMSVRSFVIFQDCGKFPALVLEDVTAFFVSAVSFETSVMEFCLCGCKLFTAKNRYLIQNGIELPNEKFRYKASRNWSQYFR